MSFDLVKRLRAAGTFDAVCHTEEAADRITALEAERDAAQARADALAEKLAKAVETLDRQAEAWSNTLELDIIAERHRTSAFLLRDEVNATLAAIKETHHD